MAVAKYVFLEKGGDYVRGREKIFWEIVDLKKGFGKWRNTSGSIARNELFRGKRENSAFCLDRPVRENQLY